jgi:hypothetical protein
MNESVSNTTLAINLVTHKNANNPSSTVYVRVEIPKIIFVPYNILNITSDIPIEYNIDKDTNPLVIVTFKLAHGNNYHLQLVTRHLD